MRSTAAPYTIRARVAGEPGRNKPGTGSITPLFSFVNTSAARRQTFAEEGGLANKPFPSIAFASATAARLHVASQIEQLRRRVIRHRKAQGCRLPDWLHAVRAARRSQAGRLSEEARVLEREQLRQQQQQQQHLRWSVSLQRGSSATPAEAQRQSPIVKNEARSPQGQPHETPTPPPPRVRHNGKHSDTI
ncbi:hypothetical protein HPB50_004422 [Hyalomma asiaticum]|uniref:Uncharacterized protein n=1 Tax=Hyalomma asiaticum TaxID=266040 RepID=A0ACB7TCA1_HYAAI|nr:hypothetical protein HPB50_004422 [Hyalomma asiaticum]